MKRTTAKLIYLKQGLIEHDWWTKCQFSSFDFTFIVQHTVQKVKTSGFCDYQIMLWTSSIIIIFIISTNEISCENDVGPLLLVVIKLASKRSVCDHNILCNKWQIFLNRSSKVACIIFGTINTFNINRLPASSTILGIRTVSKKTEDLHLYTVECHFALHQSRNLAAILTV